MKTRVFRSSKGTWYLFGRNYKDKNDKAYCNVFFPQGTEPMSTGDYIDIRIDEASCNSYQGKFGLSVFKYEILDESQIYHEEQKVQVEDTSKFGGSIKENNVVITQEELPFY